MLSIPRFVGRCALAAAATLAWFRTSGPTSATVREILRTVRALAVSDNFIEVATQWRHHDNALPDVVRQASFASVFERLSWVRFATSHLLAEDYSEINRKFRPAP
jgi:hypothetical protein